MSNGSGEWRVASGERRLGASTIVDFRSAKRRSFAERKTTITTRGLCPTLRAAGAAIVLWMLSIGPAFAQGGAMEIDPSIMQPPVQMGRPIPSWWDVKIKGSALVEGRFEFQLKNDTKLLATVTTEELALTGPQQRIRVLLPPVNDPDGVDQLWLDIKFHGRRFNQNLGSHPLRVALARKRTFMVLTAVSRVAPRRSAERDRVIRRLAFESMAANLDESANTVLTPLEPVDLPQEPMAYCAYEMAILFGDEFRLLKKPQLDALAAWVRAGGSLYLEPTGVLEQYHVDFLRNLTAFGPGDLVIQPDSNGRLTPGSIWNDERLIPLTNGLGRIVLRVDDEQPEQLMETPAWREAAAFLWRLHSDQIQTLGSQPAADISTLLQNVPETPNPYGGMSANRLSLKLPSSTSELVNWLMPEGVRMVPLWVLGLILCTFVVWIGPVDYFGLGWLKARKFTWLTFPLATILVTGLTVWITNRYMSTAETRRGLVIRDVGDDGAIVRTNRFELLFIASTRPVTTDVRKGVFSAMNTGQSLDDPYQPRMNPGMPRRYGPTGGDVVARPPARLQGRIPTEFTATQDMAKWTPQLNRMFWIPGPAANDETAVDWQALMEGVSLPEMFNSRTIADGLGSRVKQQFGPQALVAVLGSQGRWVYSQHAGWHLLNSNQFAGHVRDGISYYPAQGGQYTQALPQELNGQPELFRWLYQYSAGVPYGLFSLTSQVGPAGSEDLDDLPILDTSDPNLALLIVVVPRGDDYIVYRKLLRTGK